MERGRSVRQPVARRDVVPPRAEGVDPRGLIGQMVGHRDKLSRPLTQGAMGPLAGLLIAKWARLRRSRT